MHGLEGDRRSVMPFPRISPGNCICRIRTGATLSGHVTLEQKEVASDVPAHSQGKWRLYHHQILFLEHQSHLNRVARSEKGQSVIKLG